MKKIKEGKVSSFLTVLRVLALVFFFCVEHIPFYTDNSPPLVGSTLPLLSPTLMLYLILQLPLPSSS